MKQRLPHFILLLLLSPILLAWFTLVANVPNLDGGESFGFGAIPETKKVLLSFSGRRWVNGSEDWWSQKITFDLATESLETKRDSEIKAEWSDRIRLMPDPQDDGYWNVVNPTGKHRTTKFEFPIDPWLVGNRYAVGMDKKNIFVLDLIGEHNQVERLANQNDSWCQCPIELGETNRFYRLNRLLTPAQTAAGYTMTIDFFEIGDNSRPSLIASWPVAQPSDPYNSKILLADHIVSVDPQGTRLEYRSLESLEVVETHDVSNKVDMTKGKWYLSGKRFGHYTTSSNRIFDLERRTWLKMPEAPNYIESTLDGDSKLLLCNLDDRTTRTVINFDGTPLSIFSLHAQSYCDFLSDDRIAAMDRRVGLTFHLIDVNTGKTIKTLRPLWWVVPLLFASCLAYLAWSISWTRHSNTNIVAIATDVLLLIGLPMVALTCRLTFAGDPYDLDRLPTHVIQGAVCALVCWSAIWLNMGRGRIVLRGLPAVVSTLAVVGICRALFSKEEVTIWKSAAFVGMLLLFFLAVSDGVRRIARLAFSDTVPSHGGKATVVHLKDVFIATSCVAALVALWPRTFPGLGINWLVPLEVLLSAITGSLAGVLIAMLPDRRWIPYLAFTATLATALLMVPSWIFFTDFGWGWWNYSNQPLTVFLSALVTANSVGFRFRTSDWRFKRVAA